MYLCNVEAIPQLYSFQDYGTLLTSRANVTFILDIEQRACAHHTICTCEGNTDLVVLRSMLPSETTRQSHGLSIPIFHRDILWPFLPACRYDSDFSARFINNHRHVKDGSLTYPVISWQCSRTQKLVGDKIKHLSAWEIFEKTGYQIISFNTLLRLLWLRENVPQALEDAKTWMMMPGLLSHKLCGEFSIDPTSGSTMMAMELKDRDWSDELLSLAGVDSAFFPRWVEPGGVIGNVTKKAHEETGLCGGIPVVACGHDTQFAVIGSGASGDEAILSSGTWEILMIRSNLPSIHSANHLRHAKFAQDAIFACYPSISHHTLIHPTQAPQSRKICMYSRILRHHYNVFWHRIYPTQYLTTLILVSTPA